MNKLVFASVLTLSLTPGVLGYGEDISGQVEIIGEDHFDEGFAHRTLVIQRSQRWREAVDVDGGVPHWLRSGDNVTFTNVGRGHGPLRALQHGIFLNNPGRGNNHNDGRTRAADTAASTGTRTLQVFSLRWSDGSYATTSSAVDSSYFGTVAPFLQDASRELFAIVKAAPWYNELPIDYASFYTWWSARYSGTCKPWHLTDWLRTQGAMSAAGQSINGESVVWVLPPASATAPNCNGGAAGWGSVGGWQTWMANGYATSTFVLAHELGHNLGFHHSSKDGSEYGDNSCIMGSPWKLVYYNAAHTMEGGWLTSTAYGSAAGTGVYQLAPYVDTSAAFSHSVVLRPLRTNEGQLSASEALIVRVSSATSQSAAGFKRDGSNIFVSLRTRSDGYDTNLGTSWVGVFVHSFLNGRSDMLALITTAGGSYSIWDLRIVVDSIDLTAGTATVRVLADPVDCSYTEWSAWSACTPCGTSTRSRSVDLSAQFGGSCSGPTVETAPCPCNPEPVAPPPVNSPPPPPVNSPPPPPVNSPPPPPVNSPPPPPVNSPPPPPVDSPPPPPVDSPPPPPVDSPPPPPVNSPPPPPVDSPPPPPVDSPPPPPVNSPPPPPPMSDCEANCHAKFSNKNKGLEKCLSRCP